MSNKVGRPLKFETVEDLQEKIDNYFIECLEEETPFTITGLALALDTSRETLCNYEKKEEYFDTIKRAKTRVENYAEIKLLTGGNAAGAIFALKNFGWKDAIVNQNNNTNVEIKDEQYIQKVLEKLNGATD